MTKLLTLSLYLTAVTAGIHGFSPQTSPSSVSVSAKRSSVAGISIQHLSGDSSSTNNLDVDDDGVDVRPATKTSTRRNFFLASTITAATATLLPLSISISPAYASGGATAGKYTTIPIAKRRYYGRVQEAVHEFLLMAPAVIKGDLTDPTVQVASLSFLF